LPLCWCMGLFMALSGAGTMQEWTWDLGTDTKLI
jgi:hypothetical protein